MEEIKNKLYYIFLGIVVLIIIAGAIWGLMYRNNDNIQQVTSNIEKNKETSRDNVSIGNILNTIDEVNKEQQQVNAKDLIRIKAVTTSSPNIAGGVDLDVKWINMSDKTIKYITFTAYPINAVGDIVECTIRTYNKGQFKGQQTGPIAKGKGNKEGYVFANAWYNNTIVKAELMQIDIEYMDGTKVTLNPSQVHEVIY